MTQMEERKQSIFIFYKFSTITFDTNCSIKSKLQATEDVLNDMEIDDNKGEFYSTINVAGIFSFEKDTSIDNWLLNSVENFVGSTISLPLAEANKHIKWLLFTSLAIER